MKRKQLARIDLSDPNKPRLIYDAKSMKEDLKAFKNEERVWVTVERYYRKRTGSQNSLFHVYITEIANETGQDFEDVKSTVKLLYARKPVLDKDGMEIFNEETGERLEYVQDTSKMTTVEMADLTEKTRMFALEYFGILLELPDEQVELRFKNIK